MVIAPWKNEKNPNDQIGYYRAWIRSIEGDLCRIVFVDYGNECDIDRSKLLSCPASVASLPWLAIRVRFQQYFSHEEFKKFWFRTDSHWIKVKILRINKTHYTIQVFVDYTAVLLNEDRKKHIQLQNQFNQQDSQQSIPNSSFQILVDIQKKLNSLCDQIEQNQQINQEHFQLLEKQFQQ